MAYRRALPITGALAFLGAGGGALLQSALTVQAREKPAEDIVLNHVLPSRSEQLSKLRGSKRDSPFDVLVVGGGATGTGCAVDSISRGLSTALIEREDFASGTSCKSTKLVHGGVRYLEKAVFNLDYSQLKLVFEALKERHHILTNASHLSHALPILTPCYLWWEVPYYWAGMKAYDLVAGRDTLILSSFMSATESLSRLPTLAETRHDGATLKGSLNGLIVAFAKSQLTAYAKNWGSSWLQMVLSTFALFPYSNNVIVYYDGQFDDARLCVTLARTAAAAGAVPTNYVECKSLIKDDAGQVIGVHVQDRLSGEEMDVYAKVVINATGVFTDALRKMGDDQAGSITLPSSGVHITLPEYYSASDLGILVPKTVDGRVVFILPWLDRIIAGTTDTKCDVNPRPTPTEDEINFILETMSQYLDIDVRREDVLSAWSGIRPLAVDPKHSDSSSTSRDHVVIKEHDGMVTVVGGKWTTYRLMAHDTLEAAVQLGKLQGAGASKTANLKLLGSQTYTPKLLPQVVQAYQGNSNLAIDTPTARHLTRAYGDQTMQLLKLAEERNLCKQLVAGHPYLEAEVVWAVQHEYCQTVEDFVTRRTRLAFLDVAATLLAIPRVADLMGQELDWSAERRKHEVASARRYMETFAAHREAPKGEVKAAKNSPEGTGSNS